MGSHTWALRFLGISEIYYGLILNGLIFQQILSQNYLSIGCVTSAPDGSSPRVYIRVLVAGHRLKLYYSKDFGSLMTLMNLSTLQKIWRIVKYFVSRRNIAFAYCNDDVVCQIKIWFFCAILLLVRKTFSLAWCTSRLDQLLRSDVMWRVCHIWISRYLLSLFVSLTLKVCVLPTVSRASATVN
jgi:hypothetical protein